MSSNRSSATDINPITLATCTQHHTATRNALQPAQLLCSHVMLQHGRDRLNNMEAGNDVVWLTVVDLVEVD